MRKLSNTMLYFCIDSDITGKEVLGKEKSVIHHIYTLVHLGYQQGFTKTYKVHI